MSPAPGCAVLPPGDSDFLLLGKEKRAQCPVPALLSSLLASAASKIPVLSSGRPSEAGYIPGQRLARRRVGTRTCGSQAWVTRRGEPDTQDG